MADLFVSYARADRARVAPLVAALEAEGWSVWWDPEISPGEEFDRLIGEELGKARAVIVVWTPTSVESLWVRGEAREGRDRRVLAPVRFDGAHLPIDMRAIHTIDLDGWNEDRSSRAFGQLARALRRLTAERSPAEDRAAPTVDWIATQSRRRRSRWIGAGASVAVLAVLAFAVWRVMPAAQGPTSIAVERIGAPPGDAAAQEFADRLGGGLATMAAARPTSLKIVEPAPGDRPPGFVVGGTARTVAKTVTATLNLSSTSDHSIVWSASFTRPVAEAADLPDQAATRLADVLTCAFEGGQAYRDIEALKLFTAACAAVNAPDATDELLRDQLRKVVARAPDFAGAWGELAIVDAYILASSDSPGDAAGRRKVEDEAARALELNPREARGWVARAVAAVSLSDWPQRRAYLERALALDPDQSVALYALNDAWEDIGRTGDALAAQRRAADVDPLTPGQVANLAFAEALAGRMGEATATFAAAERRWPSDTQVSSYRAYANARMGDPAAALKALDNPAIPLEPVNRQYLRLLCQARLDPARIAEAAAFMRAHAGKDLVPSFAIQGLAELGRVDDAFQIAESNLSTIRDAKDGSEVFFRPYMAKFLASPRFMPLAARLGLVDIWRKTGLWPDYCSAEGAPYDCKAAAAKAMAAIAKPA